MLDISHTTSCPLALYYKRPYLDKAGVTGDYKWLVQEAFVVSLLVAIERRLLTKSFALESDFTSNFSLTSEYRHELM